jgi:hypothetical protein
MWHGNERVCNCLYRSHFMLFVLVRSHVTCVFLINKCVIVYTGVILCCSCSLGAVVHVFNNIEWHLYRQLHIHSWVKTHVTWLLTSTNNIECVIVYSGVILCCSCSLGAVVQMVLLINEYVIVYTGVILCCSCSLGAVVHVFLLMNA